MSDSKLWLSIEGAVQISKDHDTWLDEFIMWLESRGESFMGMTKPVEDDEDE